MTRKTFLCTILLFVAIGFVSNLQAQVTVGSNDEPKATLDVKAAASDATLAGVIAPRMDRAYLNSRDSHYGADQTGAIVYVTTLNGSKTGQAANVDKIGYYYFDGSVWQPFGSDDGGGDCATKFIQITSNTFKKITAAEIKPSAVICIMPSATAAQIELPTAGVAAGTQLTISAPYRTGGAVSLCYDNAGAAVVIGDGSKYLIEATDINSMMSNVQIDGRTAVYYYDGAGKWIAVSHY